MHYARVRFNNCHYIPHTEVSLAVRIEYTKALARKERWEEEVLTLQEEMRRVLRSLKYDIDVWKDRAANVDRTMDRVLQEGLRAYALKTAYSLEAVQSSFMAVWTKVGPARGRKAGVADERAQVAATQLVSGLSTESLEGQVISELDETL